MVLGYFISKLKERVLLMEEDEVVVLHFYLLDFLRDSIILLNKFLALRVEFFQVLELSVSYKTIPH